MSTVDLSRLRRTIAGAQASTPTAPERRLPSVLIVDQDPDSRLETARAAHAVGLRTVAEAAYGTEAAVAAVDAKPDVILIAIAATAVRAISTLEALRQAAPEAPVIAYSAATDPEVMRQAMRAGARDFLKLPLRAEALQEAVQAVLQEQERAARVPEGDLPRARGTVITIAGAKGGIGKTTLAVNFAIALRQLTGQEVALVDTDVQFGDIAVLLDMSIERGIAELVRTERTLDRRTIAAYLERHDSGVNVLGATTEPDDWRTVAPQHLVSIVSGLSETHEFVVLDTPGVMTEVVAASLQEAALVLLVTSLDISSIKDTKTALRMMELWGLPRDRVRLVINDASRASTISPKDVTDAIGMPVAAHIPYSSQVGPAGQAGAAVVEVQPQCEFARAAFELARAASGADVVAAKPRGGRLRIGKLHLAGGRS